MSSGDYLSSDDSGGAESGGDILLRSGYAERGSSGAVSLATSNSASVQADASKSSGEISLSTGAASFGRGGKIELAVGKGYSGDGGDISLIAGQSLDSQADIGGSFKGGNINIKADHILFVLIIEHM